MFILNLDLGVGWRSSCMYSGMTEQPVYSMLSKRWFLCNIMQSCDSSSILFVAISRKLDRRDLGSARKSIMNFYIVHLYKIYLDIKYFLHRGPQFMNSPNFYKRSSGLDLEFWELLPVNDPESLFRIILNYGWSQAHWPTIFAREAGSYCWFERESVLVKCKGEGNDICSRWVRSQILIRHHKYLLV